MTSSTAAEAACAFEFPSNQGENYEKMEFRLHSRVAELVGDQIRAFYDDDDGGGGGSWRIGPRTLRSVVETNILQDGDAFSEHPIYGSAIAFEPGVWTDESELEGGVPYPAASKACMEDASSCPPKAADSWENLQLTELKRNADGQALYCPYAFRGPPSESAYADCSRDQPEFCPSVDLARASEYDYTNITFSESEWYTAPRCLYLSKGTRSGYWTAPYFDAGGGEIRMVTYSQPMISRAGKFLGVATIDITVDALCYGAQCVDGLDTGKVVGYTLGVAAGVVLLLLVPFWFYRRKKKNAIKELSSTIERKSAIIKEKEEEIHRKDAKLKSFTLGTSKFGDAINFVDSLLKPGSPLKDASEVQNLLLIKQCLTRGDSKTMHVPGNLTKGRANRFIMKEFAGVTHVPTTLSASPSTVDGSPQNSGTFDCLPEFSSLDESQQTRLCELLSLSNLRRWDFNVFDVSAVDAENTLLFVAWAVIGSPHSQLAMAKQLGRKDLEPGPSDGYSFVDLDLKIETGTLCDYLRVIQGDYEDNPYHNAIHAADVVQTLHALIQMADEPFEGEELFSILVAAVVHDVKHPGRNNAFQVHVLSDLALTHNDAAVLENEHSSHAFKLMVRGAPDRDDDLNFLCHLTTAKFAEIRTRIVEAVLHTDMSRHFSTVANIKNQAAGKSWDEIDAKLRGEILMFMLHLADISNPAKGGPMFKLWTDRCLDEFFAQGDEERDRGLPVSPNCDRKETKKPESQIGFINFVVKPAYEVLADIVPSVGMNVLPVIENNLIYWEGRKGRKETV